MKITTGQPTGNHCQAYPVTFGPSVKWQDADGAWHTGETVSETTYNRFGVGHVTLVRESCDHRLTWVPVSMFDWKKILEPPADGEAGK